MSSTTQHPKFRLKDSVYALEDPVSGLYITLKGPKPKLQPLRLATLAPATPHCRSELILASSQANATGDLVRVDA